MHPFPPSPFHPFNLCNLWIPSPMTSYALYLHIPFCRARCSYCDFNTYTTLGDLQAAYVAALAREIEQVGAGAADGPPPVHTIFFGGGTPSLLTVEQVAHLLDAARAAFALDADAEITMEANPGTVSAEWLAAVRALGVNRLSFGVQSARPSELALLGRAHDFTAAIEAVEMATAAGFDNLNLDLIYGLPGQSVADWQRTLAAVLPLDVEHVSLYCLTIEPGTPMQRWLHNGTIMAPDPDTAARLTKRQVMAALAKAHRRTPEVVADRAWWDAWHVVEVEWTRSKIVFRLDGEVTRELKVKTRKADYFVVLSLLSSDWEPIRLTEPLERPGAGLDGAPIEAAELPFGMAVDWVKVYEPKP